MAAEAQKPAKKIQVLLWEPGAARPIGGRALPISEFVPTIAVIDQHGSSGADPNLYHLARNMRADQETAWTLMSNREGRGSSARARRPVARIE